MGTAFQRALGVEFPGSGELTISEKGSSKIGGYEARRLTLGRRGKGDAVPAILLMPKGAPARRAATLIVHPLGKEAVVGTKPKAIASIAERLLEKGQLVLAMDCFATGESPKPAPNPKLKYLDTYNRTETANRVQDILTALAYLRGRDDTAAINLVGLDEAGLWCLLARPFVPAVGRLVADAAELDTRKDDEFLARLYVPGLRLAGDFRTAVALSAPGEVFIHNTGRAFSAAWAADVYRSLKISPLLRVSADRASAAETVNWLIRGEGR
jgi:hypothetical protein